MARVFISTRSIQLSCCPTSQQSGGFCIHLAGCFDVTAVTAPNLDWSTNHSMYHRRKFRSQTSDNMYRWKSRGGKTQRREENGREEERRSEKRKSQKKGDAGARKGRKAAIPCVFLMICGPGGSKSRLAKAAGAEPPGQMREEKLHAVVARSTPRSEHFWKLRCRKSACRCGAKHIAKSKCTNHLWKLPCRKSARRCGAKHVSKSKCTKHLSVGPLLEVEMSKRCTPLWREAHFQVKMLKTPHVRATFGR